jgi:hypothetical protein
MIGVIPRPVIAQIRLQHESGGANGEEQADFFHPR